MNKIDKDCYIIIRNSEQCLIAREFFNSFDPELAIANLNENDIKNGKFILIIYQDNELHTFFNPTPVVIRTVIETNLINISNPFFVSFSNEKNCDITLHAINSYIYCLEKKLLPYEKFSGKFSWENDKQTLKIENDNDLKNSINNMISNIDEVDELKQILNEIEKEYIKGDKSCA